MAYLVLCAEVFTLMFATVFVIALSSSRSTSGFWDVATADPVGRTLIRSAQIAFALGYGSLFCWSAFAAISV